MLPVSSINLPSMSAEECAAYRTFSASHYFARWRRIGHDYMLWRRNDDGEDWQKLDPK
ncbi:hypothetical protein SPHV1_2270197 [Novosphingobium sp. KN65.2]|nr:hypothetical protein SPHV1_2270197 [Novosphingobium sp. KN65.2]